MKLKLSSQPLPIFEEANIIIRKNHNSNVYWSQVSLAEKIWIRTIAQLFDKRLKEYEKKLYELEQKLNEKIFL